MTGPRQSNYGEGFTPFRERTTTLDAHLQLSFGLALAVPPLAAAHAAPVAADVYHIHFTKAVPGQTTALAEELKKPNPSDPMLEYFLVLRHQEGDDWDYCVIAHLGAKAAVSRAPTRPDPAAPNEVWSADFVFDRTAEGWVLKCLAIVDDATTEAVAIIPARALGSLAVTRGLDRVAVTSAPTMASSSAAARC